MTDIGPWLAVAGLGALHGLSPANGWMFAAACGVRARNAARARLALLPIAIGHAVSIVLVAAAVAQGVSIDRAPIQVAAGGLLIGLASWRLLAGARRPRASVDHETGHAGIALWSFLMASAHGTGLMLVPALMPMCLAGNPAREIAASGSAMLVLLAVGLHIAAMLVTTAAMAGGVCRAVAAGPRLLDGHARRQAWTATLAITGGLLVLLR